MTPKQRACLAVELLAEAILAVLADEPEPPGQRQIADRLDVHYWFVDSAVHLMAEDGRVHQPAGPRTGWAIIEPTA